MDISLRFENGDRKIEIGRGKAYRLLRVEGLESSQNEIYTTVNAYGDGLQVDNKKIKSKPLLVEAEYQGQDKEGERRRLISFFNLHKKGDVVAKVGGIEKSIEYVVENFNSRLINVNNPLTFLVSLLCPDPFFKDIEAKSAEIVSWIGGLTFPLKLPTTFSLAGEESINVINSGDVDTPMQIEIRGKATKPMIQNTRTGEFIKINRTLIEGDTLIITTEFGKKRVEQNGISVFNYIDISSTFFDLRVGDNVITMTTEDLNDDANVKITYKNRYLGV